MPNDDFLNLPFFTPEHGSLRESLFTWAKEALAENDESKDERKEARRLVSLLGEQGALKYVIPSEFGGVHEKIDARSLCIVRETLAYFSGLADFGFAMQGLGAAPIAHFGSSDLQQKYLPKISSGECITTFAISEREAGSDVAANQATAELDGDDYVLNGEKTWISNGGLADFYVLFARTGDAPGAKGLSAFVVEADTPGFTVPEEIRITSPHPLGTLRFEDCRIPKSNLIGDSGSGFKIAMATLDLFRSTVGAAALGFAKRAYEESIEHAAQRKLFGQTLADFQMTQERLADMATEIDASALLVYRAAWLKDSGQDRVTREASMAKMYSTEAAQVIIDKAVQMLGGKGVTHGSLVERLYRDIRPLRIYEGATEIQKIVIARHELKQRAAE